ncbi:c-type cytochrome [Piscinibacter sp.]|uniref:c-type cytochrome n=1 Tax=Piscinibacter sp. TaxID=1903157 RepID=UPI0039E65D3D
MNPAALVPSLMSGLLAAALAFPAAATEAAAAKPDLAKGEATATAVCGACHTFDGSRGTPANPILAGQHAEYLAKQLGDFKSGKRSDAVMQGMAATLATDADIRNVAAFFAAKSAKPGFAGNKATVARGEKIWRGGIAERKVPACAGCHGPAGAGIPSEYPRLAGQHAVYTEAQLLAFRDGKRKNNAQMAGVTAGMTEADIKAVADYVAGLR